MSYSIENLRLKNRQVNKTIINSCHSIHRESSFPESCKFLKSPFNYAVKYIPSFGSSLGNATIYIYIYIHTSLLSVNEPLNQLVVF